MWKKQKAMQGEKHLKHNAIIDNLRETFFFISAALGLICGTWDLCCSVWDLSL